MTASICWQDANRNYLMANLAVIRAFLEKKVQDSRAMAQAQKALHKATDALPAQASLTRLSQLFRLSSFEQGVLLMCLGVELDASFSRLYATAQDDPQRDFPTFSLALSALPDPHWSALTSHSPLQRWHLIKIGTGEVLTLSPLRIEERILHFLVGSDHLEEQLQHLVYPLDAPTELAPSHQVLAQLIANTLTQKGVNSFLPVVQLCGDDATSKRAIAAAACSLLGFSPFLLTAQALPLANAALQNFVTRWEREANLGARALLLDCDELHSSDDGLEAAVVRFMEQVRCPLLLLTRDRRRSHLRSIITYDVLPPNSDEQRQIWQVALGSRAADLNGQVNRLVAHFNLSLPTIQAACAETLVRLEDPDDSSSLERALWDTCRKQARPRLEDLAQRMEGTPSWEDLVLPEAQRQVLMDITAHVRQRAKVYSQWGFADKGGRGLGISALFAGASGTGKTMAAEVIAQALGLDLYRIDLSAVVSKYIGETEKNLRRIFDAAEISSAVLLFDEADALFGKRSEVKDSHDRHANIEVSYLLQRMEAYRGLAILTTNLKDALDSAFLRRIRFMVRFPFPDAAQRAEIWQRIFPKATPTEGLDVHKLARLNVAGGNIRNIALNAAFLAADAEESVQMKHLLRSARSEYTKLEKPLTDAEVKGWV
ncbi:ATP-binding protein [Anthocerotibacter panamensis]|uniref:ATP-binding protein n=1 Tax=Anthocerotibacter panamensis TaxID=2857077 RepID=UPI001C403D04|nr:ATP-binding protein [Anthocerotibacter panamensis]